MCRFGVFDEKLPETFKFHARPPCHYVLVVVHHHGAAKAWVVFLLGVLYRSCLRLSEVGQGYQSSRDGCFFVGAYEVVGASCRGIRGRASGAMGSVFGRRANQ